ncbi:MAG TPA: NAD(P)/FAD-dependent oxidoreductase [Mycobacterium sp.]|nr:NAD(P)/FAD-dependent oxidoreductase [Mycobacterium sp.]
MTRRNTECAQTTRTTFDPATAERAVAVADLRALLMMVFHYTGDRYWLSERFHPVRDVRLIAPEDAGLPMDVQQELRDAAVAALCSPTPPVLTDPDDTLFLTMMRIALGEQVPAEYVPMMREQMGLAPSLELSDHPPIVLDPAVLPVLIVGAGESGIALGAILNDLGVAYQIVERGDTVGGTWRDNIYPGCAVDTPNHSYSYSFGKRYPWTHFFSDQPEIQDYLERSADDFDVRQHIRFNTTCVGAEWDEGQHDWKVLLEHGSDQEWVRTRFLVSALGPFGEPQIPNIPGIDDFAGPVVHSARWSEHLDLAGRSVAIIGTGASCMQIAPTVADAVARLSILQRTAQWVRPIDRFHERIDDDVQALLQGEPYYSCWFRFVMLWRYGDGLLATLRKDPTWPHPQRSVNKTNDRHREQMTAHIRDALAERPSLLAKCVPDYPPYGKRILLDNGWYETLLKPNVDLVTTAIDHIEAGGVRMADDSLVEADLLVMATGFDVSRSAARLDIRGSEGRSLADEWAGGIGAYLGITVPGFPNFFILQGPTTGLGHGGSAIFTSEVQARYVALTIVEMFSSGIETIDVKPEVYAEYLARVDAAHDQLVWSHPGMKPYYRDEFGKIRTVLPWRLVDYFDMTRRPDFTDFNVTAGVTESDVVR